MSNTPKVPGASPISEKLPAVPFLMCLYCCQAMKKGLQNQLHPAITMTIIFINNMPVSAPSCFDHLQVGSDLLVN